MKNIIKLISKAVMVIVAAVCLIPENASAGLIVSNVTSGTQVVYTGNKRVWQIVAYGTTANVLNFHDSQYSSNAYTQPAYTRSTNYTITLTNLTTNGVFVYDTVTQYMIQTNRVTGNARSNITVSAAVVQAPLATTVPVVAATITTVPNLDLTFVNGITVTATNSATIILYTRD